MSGAGMQSIRESARVVTTRIPRCTETGSNPTLFYTFQSKSHPAKPFRISHLGIRNTVLQGAVRISPLFSTTFNATLVS